MITGYRKKVITDVIYLKRKTQTKAKKKIFIGFSRGCVI